MIQDPGNSIIVCSQRIDLQRPLRLSWVMDCIAGNILERLR